VQRRVITDAGTFLLSAGLACLVQEAADRGYDLKKFHDVGIVLHHPRLNQLLAKFTSRSESPFEPAFGEAVCVRAGSLQDFVKGKGLEHCRL
jgi:hypothetical protein